MSVRVRRSGRAVLHAGKTSFSLGVAQVKGSTYLRIAERCPSGIRREIYVPDDYVFEFMEIFIHLAAFMETCQQSRSGGSEGSLVKKVCRGESGAARLSRRSRRR